MKTLASVKNFLSLQIVGTRFEPWARGIWDIFNPLSSDDIRKRQTLANMSQIMSSVLTKDSNCVDVGCHKGAILGLMLRFAPQGHHYAFEPIPNLAEVLERKFPRVEVRQLALSNSEGEVSFNHVLSRPGYSGLNKRPYPSSNEVVEIIKVQTQRLDDVLPSDFKVQFIKVDVEGAEFELFKGAIRTIKTHRPYILFEFSPPAAKCYDSTSDMVYELLVHECGMKIFGLRGWLSNSSPLSQDEFNSMRECDFLAAP